MVAAVTAIVDGEPLPAVAVSGAPVVLRPHGQVERLVLLDEHGNTVRVIAAPGDGPAAGADPAERPASSDPPFLRRWSTWAIPAAVFTGTGVAFLVGAERAKGRLDDILASSGTHFFDEAEQERRNWKDDALIADIAFAAAGAFAVTAIVMAVTRPSPGAQASQTMVTPTIGADHVGFALVSKF
jgi:hypothetical protein